MELPIDLPPRFSQALRTPLRVVRFYIVISQAMFLFTEVFNNAWNENESPYQLFFFIYNHLFIHLLILYTSMHVPHSIDYTSHSAKSFHDQNPARFWQVEYRNVTIYNSNSNKHRG